jgi:uncharacterized membrane protein YkvA (DUF1232 family)
MIRLLVFVALGIALYFGLRRLTPQRAVSAKQWLIAVGVIVLVVAYVRSPIDLIPDGTPIGFLDDILIATGAYVWLRRRLGVESSQRPQEHRQERKRATPKAGWDPYAVLGLRPGASHADISRAYRTQMKRYHPDRVDDLGEELQRVAHEKTLEIQRAYAELRGRQGSSSS